jgi:hypothetical protein
VIAKADHAVAAFGEPGGATGVMLRGCRFEMLRAIEFHDESLREANEVDDVRTERGLAAELVAVELAGAEVEPEAFLGAGGLIAEAAGEIALVAVAVHGGVL